MGRHRKVCECCQKIHEQVPKKEYEPVPPPRDPIKGRKTSDAKIRAVNKYRQKDYPKQMARKQSLEYYYNNKDQVLKKRKIFYEANKDNIREYQQEYQQKYRQTIRELKQLPFYGQEFEDKCVLCNSILKTYNNPDPLAKDGDCCDECNRTKVIPARRRLVGL